MRYEKLMLIQQKCLYILQTARYNAQVNNYINLG